MNNTLRTVEGRYPTFIIHHNSDGEIQMIENLTTDIIRISNEPNGSGKHTWAMFSLGLAVSCSLTLIGFLMVDGFGSIKVALSMTTLFSLFFGVYSYRDGDSTKQSRDTRLTEKQEQLKSLIGEIKSRASESESTEYSEHAEAIEASMLSLSTISEAS